MTNGRRPTLPQMPSRPANLPPTNHNIAPMHEEYSQEAARAAQRYFDMTADITRLTGEAEEWRRRALMAEEEIKRGEMREKNLNEKLEATSVKLTNERDNYKHRLVELRAEFSTAGNIILRCMQAADMLAGQPKVDIDKLVAEIERNEDPMPSVVTAGPRND
jgi:predicted  nucleic acid-binding Zn-ribbon protein